jgi:branched-chain amino acid transport system ATP-binding protein
MLAIQNISVSYGAIRALHGVTLSVPEGGIVTLIGSNGAGKSTTLRTVSGLIRPREGSITYCGERIDGMAPHRIVQRADRAVVHAEILDGEHQWATAAGASSPR